MVTVIDLNKGTITYQGREDEPEAVTRKALPDFHCALQTLSDRTLAPKKPQLPHDVANCSVENLLKRWES